MAVPVGRLGPMFRVSIGVLLYVPENNRTWSLYAFAPSALENDVGGGMPSEAPSPENSWAFRCAPCLCVSTSRVVVV